MFERIAARPLVLTAALLLFPACNSGDGDGGETEVDASTSGTTDPGMTGPTEGSTGPTEGSTGPTEGSTGPTEGSTDDEDSSSGGNSSSSGGTTLGLADIEGTYVETWGPGDSDFFIHEVTTESWTIDFGQGMSVLSYETLDDDTRWIAGDDGLGSYTRYDWDLDADDNLRYCTAIIAAVTLQEAIDAPPSNRDDFDGTGCAASFPWSLLELQE